MPKRIQRKRTKGWTMPENTVYVGRPTIWGNPFPVNDPLLPHHLSKEDKHQAVVDQYRKWLGDGEGGFATQRTTILTNLHVLKGVDLACWCTLDKPCHADVLLEMANGTKQDYPSGAQAPKNK